MPRDMYDEIMHTAFSRTKACIELIDPPGESETKTETEWEMT
jgi:hypothetical protein